MNNITSYDFGYSWPITYGHLVPLTIAVVVAALALWRDWPRVVTILAGVLGLWALAGFLVVHFLFGLTSPMELPTDSDDSSKSQRIDE